MAFGLGAELWIGTEIGHLERALGCGLRIVYPRYGIGIRHLGLAKGPGAEIWHGKVHKDMSLGHVSEI